MARLLHYLQNGRKTMEECEVAIRLSGRFDGTGKGRVFRSRVQSAMRSYKPCLLSQAWLAGERQAGYPKPRGIELADMYMLPLAPSCLPEELRLCHEAVREFLSRGDPVANPSADAVFHKHVKDTESRLRMSDFVRSCTYFLVRADLFEEALEEPMLRVALFKLVLSIVYIGKGYNTRVESHLKQAFREEQTCLKTEFINEAWKHGASSRILVKE